MDQVEQVKQKTDIVQIIGERVDLKKAGRNFKGLCPFHSEKSPSFMVSPERQTYKCFGCGEGGDVFTFLQKYEGMSFLESLEVLAERAGVQLEEYKPSSQDLRKKRLLEVLHLAGEYYSWILDNHKVAGVARKYLKKRGITSEAIRTFQLGYAPDNWRNVSEFLVEKKGYKEEDLYDVGLVIQSDKGHYDRFRGRVMFPLRDHKGSIVGFSGRTLSKDKNQAKYINSPETRLYSKGDMLYGLYENRSYVRKDDRIVLVEGELDMIPSWQAGVKSVVAIKGSAFTEEQARLIARHTQNIVMALDADMAGQEAIKRAVRTADSLDLRISIVQIKEGKDPGDIATENAKNWRDLVKGAVSYYDFLLDSLMGRNDVTKGEGAQAVTDEFIPALSGISNMVVRAHYVKELAKNLDVPEESVYGEIDRIQKKQEFNILKEKVKDIEVSSVSRRERVEEYLLSLSLQKYREIRDELKEIDLTWFLSPAVKKVIEKLVLVKNDSLDMGKFGAKFPPELQETIDNAYLRDLSSLDEGVASVKEYIKIREEVATLSIRDSMHELTDRIAEAEQTGKDSRLKELQAEFTNLSKQLASLG